MHEGVDIAAATGSVVRAPAAGRVVYVGTKENFGNYVAIDHGGGLTTHYGHLSSSLVADGDEIRLGTPIALVGSTGRSTGPHLHYEIRVMDLPVDPRTYLPEDPEEEPLLAQGP
ncbi:MAG: M23 family metallopeptidase [Deltaproteobacteria bacterium]|nr:M23 family metallopeptidase [Deltaproteobacteria bacterium]